MNCFDITPEQYKKSISEATQRCDFLAMQHERIEESLKQAQELQETRTKLEKTKSEIRKMKIDVLKNESRKDKINLLIEERLQELEAEESASMYNINPETAKLMAECCYTK